MRVAANQRGYVYGHREFDMARSCGRALPHLKSKQAARDVDHVSVLDIFWVDRVASNAWPKINRLRSLNSVDYASEMNVAEASIISYSARLHNCLVNGRWALK